MFILIMTAYAGKNFQTNQGSLQRSYEEKNMKKICNPHLICIKYFVLSTFLAKLPSHIVLFNTCEHKSDLEGYLDFHTKPSGWCKKW